MKRRALLASIGTVSATAVAGCLNVGGQSPGNRSPDDGTEPPEVVSSNLETTEAGCGAEATGYEWSVEDDTIVVTGSRTAPNPCHRATLEDVRVDDGVLELEIGLAQATDEGVDCMQCVGEISYEATVELGDVSSIETVDVLGTDPTGEPMVESTSIETLSASCGTGTVDYSWSVEGGAIVIEGRRFAPNPCHEAVLGSVLLDGDALVVDVGVASTSDRNEVCVECVGEVQYELTVEMSDPSSVSRVEVRGDDFASAQVQV